MARTATLSLLVGLVGLLLLCAGAGGQLDGLNIYEPNALYAGCGRSCRNASLCGATDTEIETTEVNLLCRCDSEYRRYGDCCANANASNCYRAQSQQNTTITTYTEEERQLEGSLQCSSVHLDPRTMPDWMESLWMVSACPRDWLAGREDPLLLNTEENCRSGSATLPPVTDLQSGLVYRNEYCAVCHEVENILPWGYRFECTPWLRDMVSAGLQLNREIIERECIACGFRAPQTMPVPARACLHNSLLSAECLAREELENVTGVPIEEEQYQYIVGQCETGPISPIGYPTIFTFVSFVIIRIYSVSFRNQYCTLCNGVRVNWCVDPYTARDPTDHCRETAANLMPERPTTPPTAAPTTGSGWVLVFGPAPGPDQLAPPFTIFLDVNRDSQVVTMETTTVNITTSCPDGKVFDPIARSCRPTICPEGFATHRASCAIVQNIAFLGSGNVTVNDSCDGTLVPLEEDEFELLGNKTLLFQDNIFDIFGYTNSSPIICTNLTQNGTFENNVTVFFYSYPTVFSILTYVGCTLSVIGCTFVLLTYSLFRELHTLPPPSWLHPCSSLSGSPCLFWARGMSSVTLRLYCCTGWRSVSSPGWQS